MHGGPPPHIAAPIRANDAPPEIVAVWFSRPAYRWGDVATIRLVASTNVAAVEMRFASYGRPLRRVGYGQFHGNYHVPLLPPFIRPRYAAPFQFIARNSFGRSQAVTASLLIR